MSETADTAVTCGECKFMFFGTEAVAQFMEHPCMARDKAAIEVANFDAAKPEPPPVVNNREAIQDLVVEDVVARKAKGIAEYGTPLQAFNGRDALNDLYQEMLDAIFYLRQLIYERAVEPAMLHQAVDDGCSCGCSASDQCGLRGCVHEQP